MMPVRRLVLCALLVLVAGCSKKTTAPLPPAAPPVIEEVFPPPRAAGVSYETEIWARFSEALDSTTVNTRNVVVFLDTRVIPSAVSWNAQTRRIVIRLLVPLALDRTHTVRLEPDLASENGVRLGEEYFWQFKTVGVRPPDDPFPPDGAVDESPFVTLMWRASDAENDEVLYSVYAGPDSTAVATRAVPPVDATSKPYLLPEIRWNHGTAYYWSVTAYNPTTRDVSAGPVWRFDTMPAGRPVDSIELPLSDWTSYDARADSSSCYDPRFNVGSPWDAALRWDLALLGPRKLDHVVIRAGTTGLPPFLAIFAAESDWRACDMRNLEKGRQLSSAPYGVFNADLLTAHVEACLRHQGFWGYVLTGPDQATLTASRTNLEVHFFRE